MADRKKFEEMLERLINEDREGAEALFHELVVEKSRDIYESLLEDDLDIEEASDEDEDEDEVEESSDEDEDEDEATNEDFNLDEFEVEADPMDAMGGDPADDMLGDIEMGADDEDEMGDEEGEEGGLEDRFDDLEDAFDQLKAEFEKMMGGDEGEGDFGGDEEGEEGEEEGEEEEGEEEKEAFNFGEADEDDDEDEVSETKSAAEQMREYVEKVAPAKMGDNGANTKSAVAGKNDMGGTTSNIVRNDTEAGVEANKGQLKGNGVFKGGSPKEDNAGNVNVPGGKASKSMKAEPKGHGAEKKGAGETAANKKPVVGG